jgi:hypothetical protein
VECGSSAAAFLPICHLLPNPPLFPVAPQASVPPATKLSTSIFALTAMEFMSKYFVSPRKDLREIGKVSTGP